MDKIKICCVTATRSEYGIIAPVIREFLQNDNFDVRVVVTGAHLSPEFGLTYNEIEGDGIAIDKKIEMLVSSDTPSAIAKSMALAMIGFADYFTDRKPDLLLLLGDRYEALAVAACAINFGIPIAHISGGDVTEGAVDDMVRHSLTKMSLLHFTATELHRQRVIQMGENPNRVFWVGATSVESAIKETRMTLEEFKESVDFDWGDNSLAVVTFHPVTLENCTAHQQCVELLKALDGIDGLCMIFTKANADRDGRVINRLIDEYVSKHSDRACVFTSLGHKRYINALVYADVVVGNSSSGLSEAPSFHIPTVNIGDRQKGRTCGETVISCKPNESEIKKTIEEALSAEFKDKIKDAPNPYEKSETSKNIVAIVEEYAMKNELCNMKSFYMLGEK